VEGFCCCVSFNVECVAIEETARALKEVVRESLAEGVAQDVAAPG
jgi:hypothetical protein